MLQPDRQRDNNSDYAYCIDESDQIVSGWVIGKNFLISELIIRYRNSESRVLLDKELPHIGQSFKGFQTNHPCGFSFHPLKHEDFSLLIQLGDSIVEITKLRVFGKKPSPLPINSAKFPFFMNRQQRQFNEIGTQFDVADIDGIVEKLPNPLSGKHLSYYNLMPEGIQSVQPCIWSGNIPDSMRKRFDNTTSHIPPANLYEFHDVYLVGQGCIVDKNQRLFFSKHLHMNHAQLKMGRINPILISTNPNDTSKVSFNKKLKTRKIDRSICIPLSQPGESVYGHFLVDILPRVIFAQEIGTKLKYISTIHLPEWAKKFLHLLGIKNEDIITYDPMTEVLFMKHCLFPGHLRQESAFSPLASKLRESLAPFGSTPKNRRLFVSRGNFNKAQHITNFNELNTLIVRYGLELIEPHKLSIEEQISIFSEATLIVGEYGSAMHNSFFSYPNTNVLVLQSDSTLPFVQAGIGALLDQPTGFVFGKHVEKYNKKGRSRSFRAPLHAISRAIESIG